MKVQPVVNQLISEMPLHSNFFDTNFEITSLVTSGTTATATTSSPHGLSVGQGFIISGAIDLTLLDTLSVTNNVATATCSVDHGLSMGMDNKTFSVPAKVEIDGATPAAFNGEHTLKTVSNRQTFQFNLTLADQVATGTITSKKYDSTRFWDSKVVATVPSTTEFTFTIDSGFDGSILGTKRVHYNPRISSAATIQRAIDSYTKQAEGQFWMFVVPAASTSSKDRNILNDAAIANTPGDEYRIRLIDDVIILIFCPAQNQISGVDIADTLEDQKIAMFKSLLGYLPPAQYDAGPTTQFAFISSQIILYNKSYIVGQYIYELLQDVTFNDILNKRKIFPARDISSVMEIKLDNGDSQDLDYNLDLDEDPL